MSITSTLENCFQNMAVNTKDIVIDDKGQRDVEARRAQFNRIMRDFNPVKVNEPKLALVDGKYYCFDGQMTIKVLKAKNDGNDLNVPCKVYKGLTLYDAAMLFCQQDENSSKVTPAQIIRVQFNYGDKEATEFVRETENNGMHISWNGYKFKYAITAVSSAFDVFKQLNDCKLYGMMVRVIKNAWGDDEKAVSTKMIRGLGLFMKAYADEIDEERLTRKLQLTRPVDLIRDAEVDRSSSYRKYAVKILEAYNKSARDNQRLDYKF